MLDRLLTLFETPADTPGSEDDREERVRLATSVVLLEAARIDEDFSEQEKEHILDQLRRRYSLSEADAVELMEASHASRKESADLWRYTNQINQHCDNIEKLEIVEEAWRVVVADGGIHGKETHFMRQLGKLLNLNHRQVIDAKMRVLGEVRGEDAEDPT